MCLNSISINTKYDRKRKEFVGTGYKCYSNYDIPKKGVWLKASGNWNSKSINYNRTINSNDYQLYWPGFHIWPDLNDAIKYKHYGIYNYIYEVRFSNIIAVGTNEVNIHSNGACIIAQNMKLHRKLAKDDNGNYT